MAISNGSNESVRGRVKTWNAGRGFGFVSLKGGKEVYVHSSLLKGGKLKVNEEVYVTFEDRSHASGRMVAKSITGYGVQPRGKVSGTVLSWNPSKRFGFIRTASGEDVFVHQKDLGGDNLELVEGARVTCDVVDKLHESGRREAVNIGGPGLRSVGDGLKDFIHSCGVEVDDATMAKLRQENITSAHDLLNRKPHELTSLGFNRGAAQRLLQCVQQHVQYMAYVHSAPLNNHPRPVQLADGEARGRVKTWNADKGFGFIMGRDGKQVYVHSQTIDGGSLIPNEDVIYKAEDKAHASGRLVATMVKGYGVKKRGNTQGVVESWNPGKSFGFVRPAGSTSDDLLFVHLQDLPSSDLALCPGKTVFFDIVDKKHPTGRKNAVNISGPGIISSQDFATWQVVPPPMKGGVKGKGFKGAPPAMMMKGGKGMMMFPAARGRGGYGKGYY